MKTVRLITCDNVTEAYQTKDKLENAGIYCMLTNEHFTNMLPIYNGMLGAGIQILVFEDDFESAYSIVSDKKEGCHQGKCPFCGAEKISFGFAKKPYSKWVLLLVSLVNFLPIKQFQPRYYCEKCGVDI